MTDSLSVQPQIQKKDNTIPYGVAGAAIGGVGGAVAANYGYGIKRKPDLDKVFAMDPDTFKRNIENAGENKGAWETAQEYANKIQEAEKEYEAQVAKIKEEAKSAVDNLPADDNAKKTLDEARKNYAKALEQEKINLKRNNKGTRITSFLKPEDALAKGAYKDFATQNEYTKLYNDYASKLDAANESSVNKKKIDKFQKELNNYFKELRNKTENVKDVGKKDIENLANIIRDKHIIEEEITKFNDFKEKGYKSANEYEKAYKTEIREKQINFAKEILGETKDVSVKNAKGKEKTVKVFTNAYGDMQSYNKKNEKMKNLSQDLLDKIAKKGTLEYQEPGGTKNVKVEKLGDLKSVTDYDDLLKKIKPGTKANDQQRSIINTLKDLAQRKEKVEQEFKTSSNNFYKELSMVKELKNNAHKEVELAVKTEKGKLLKFIYKKGNEQLKSLMPAETNTINEAEIEAQAKKALEGKEVATKLKDAEKLAQKVAEEAGLVKEISDADIINKIGTKEEFVKAIKDEAKENVGKNLEKMKIANKTWTGLAAAAALGLAGMGIAMMSRKDA